MAITKNHPINATLKKAVDYICNPAKTDGTLLVYSYGCAPETADIEFEWTREKAREPGPHLARHLIQAFKPGETTPEQAHEIGKQLAEEVLGGKYEYVLTTHIDRGHMYCGCHQEWVCSLPKPYSPERFFHPSFCAALCWPEGTAPALLHTSPVLP